MKRIAYILIIVFVTFSGGVAQKVIQLRDIENLQSLGERMMFLEDKTGKLTIQDVLKVKNQQKFQSNSGEQFIKPATSSAYWFKLSLQNFTPENAWLSLGRSESFYIDFYAPDSLGQYRKALQTGILRPRQSKPYPIINDFWLPLNLANDTQTNTYYIRIKQLVSYELTMKVGTLRALNQYKDIIDGLNMAFLGIVLIMILYNSFLFFMTKENIYLFYVSYILISALILTFVNSYPVVDAITNYQFTYFWYHYFAAWASLGVYVISVFCIKYLELKKYAPRLRWTLKVLELLAGLLGFLSITNLLPEIILIDIYQLITLLVTILCFSASLYVLWVKKITQARYYMLGWSFYILSIIIFIFEINGVLPKNIYLQNFLYFGMAIEVWLFSLALGDRFRTIRKEKEAAQAENLKLISEQNTFLNQKVEERTRELQEQKEELRQSVEELKATQEFLEQKQDEVLQKNEYIEKLYDDLNSSISYARNIQKAILPSPESFKSALPESFVYIEPRDVVSGDFYYMQKVKDKVVLAAIDCTGHGVPGAFMSLIGNDVLTNIVVNQKVSEPNVILEKLHEGIRFLLRQQETHNRDGMDLALVVIDSQNKTLSFSGAKNPLVYIQNDQLQVIKGDKMPIGGEQRETVRNFTTHTITWNEPTAIYLFSDGYQDQFGGPEGRKFMRHRFYDLLLQHHAQPMAQQKVTFSQMFDEWKGDENQIDDVLLIGVRLE